MRTIKLWAYNAVVTIDFKTENQSSYSRNI